MSRNIEIALSHRWALIGATGAGKTHFSKRLLWAYARGVQFSLPIFILDTKGYMASLRGKDDFREFYRKGIGNLVRGQAFPDVKKAFKLAATKQQPFVVWQPEFDEFDTYDSFFQSVYQSGIPQIVMVDELGSITQGEGGPAPRYYNTLLKQGRGLDICTIGCTQSPAFLPRGGQFLRQTTHIVRFRLNDDYGAEKLSKTGGKRMLEEPNHEHGFWYRDATRPVAKNPPLYYEDMKDFFGDE